MALKRLFDVVGALVLLALTAPLFAVIALLVKLDSSGPVLYRSRRLGRNGRLFDMYKFRTMRPDLGPDVPVEAKLTRVGRLLRPALLDELPQLFNVLKGEMSLIGPRPPEPQSVDAQDPACRQVLAYPPGISGLAQLSLPNRYGGPRSTAEQELDLRYIRERTLMLDARLLARTIRSVIGQWAAHARKG